MITLKYKIEYNTNPLYPHSVETSAVSLPVNSEEEANEYLDLASNRGTILEVVLVWGISHRIDGVSAWFSRYSVLDFQS